MVRKAMVSTCTDSPLCLAALWELEEAGFRLSVNLTGVVGSSVWSTEPHLVIGTTACLPFWTVTLQRLVTDLLWERWGHAEAGGNHTYSSPLGLLFGICGPGLKELQVMVHGTDAPPPPTHPPMAGCQHRGLQVTLYFLKTFVLWKNQLQAHHPEKTPVNILVYSLPPAPLHKQWFPF